MSRLIYPDTPSALPPGMQWDPFNSYIESLCFSSFSSLPPAEPLLSWRFPSETPGVLAVGLLCSAHFTEGVGRYMCDMLAKRLVPGASLSIRTACSHRFRFTTAPASCYFFNHLLIDIPSEEFLLIAKRRSSLLEKEFLLTLSSVRYTRKLLAHVSLSDDQKRALLEQHLSSSLSSNHSKTRLFHHFQQLWTHLQAEAKQEQLRDHLQPFLHSRRFPLDASLFEEMKEAHLFLNNSTIASRPPRLLLRLITYHYLFGLPPFSSAPVSLKILKQLEGGECRRTLGLCGSLHLSQEGALFEEKHLLTALSHCSLSLRPLAESLLLIPMKPHHRRFFYIEIQKENGQPFTGEDISLLSKQLPKELVESIENRQSTLSEHRNEEEVLRNILQLSQQLKFISDPPQLILSFENQTEASLHFTLVLVKVKKPKEPSLDFLLKEFPFSFTIKELEIKQAGLLRKRYLKQAAVLRVALNKGPFIRRDFSIDLLKARQSLLSQLQRLFSNVRDFNGGLLSKQQEHFLLLKTCAGPLSSKQEFLLENFFYALSPALRQTLISPHLLNTLFQLLLEALDSASPLFAKTLEQDGSLLVLIASSQEKNIKEHATTLLATLNIPPALLSHLSLYVYGVSVVGYIYQHPQSASRQELREVLLEGLAAKCFATP